MFTGKTDVDLDEEPPVKLERAQAQDEMVTLFGSERQKRAYAAYKRNKVGGKALETALVSAVSHADAAQSIAVQGKITQNRMDHFSPVYMYIYACKYIRIYIRICI